MSRTQKIDKQAGNVSYTGSWSGGASGSEVQVSSTNHLSIENTVGVFDDYRTNLANTSGSSAIVLQDGVHFSYGKRLDASTAEDGTDGFGSTAGGIYDLAASGAFTGIRCIRLIYNNKNIKDVTGLAITKVYAKNSTISSQWLAPPTNTAYVDPKNGKYRLPGPLYWSKMETIAQMTTSATIYDPANVPILTPTLTGSGTYGAAPIKFGNGVYASAGGGVGSGTADIYVAMKGETVISTKGTYSYWVKLYDDCAGSFARVVSFISNVGGTYIEHKWANNGANMTNIYVVNGVLNTETIPASTAIMHHYIIWDYDKGLTGGKSMRCWRNGAEIFSSSATINSMGSSSAIYLIAASTTTGVAGTATTSLDNVKYWDHVVSEDPSWEYNGGAGRESAIHAQYSADSYIPNSNQKTGYFYIPIGDTPLVSAGTGGDEDPEVQSTVTTNATGQFGAGGALTKDDFATIIPYQYEKRLDASTTEDPTDGYGAIAGGCVDTSTGGALATDRYVRLVANVLNVKDADYPTTAYGGLKIYSKSLPQSSSSQWASPLSDRMYIDPSNGKFVMPRPVYWSKCQSLSDLTSPEIGLGTSTYGIYTLTGSSGYEIAGTGKWGNWLGAWAGNGVGPNGSCEMYLHPYVGKYFTKGTFSAWIFAYCDVAATTIGRVMISQGLQFGGVFNSQTTNNISGIWIDGAMPVTVPGGWTVAGPVTYTHIYMVWDRDKTLSGGKSIKIFKNGIEILSTALQWTIIPSENFQISLLGYVGPGGSGRAYIDNIKLWDHVVTEDPSFEYFAGAGREDAMHNIYGATNNYKPNLAAASSGVGYFRGGCASRQCTITV